MKLRLPKARRHRALLYVVSFALIALAVDLVWVRMWRRITIGYDTTRITGPLKADGTPDYLAYLNAKASEGVTRENNAAIPLIEAGVLICANEQVREEIRRIVGSAPEVGRGEVTPFDRFYERQHPRGEYDESFFVKLQHAEMAVTSRPWSSEDYPEAEEWLSAHGRVLACVPAIAARPRYYYPTISQERLLIAEALPSLGTIRNLGRLIQARAMRHTQRGEFEAARSDLAASHHLARLLTQESFLISVLSAFAIDVDSSRADIGFLTSPGVPAEEVKAYLNELRKMPPLQSIARALDMQRYATLDVLTYTSRHSDGWRLFEPERPHPWWEGVSRLQPAHFDDALMQVNQYFDELVHGIQSASTSERMMDAGPVSARAAERRLRESEGLFADPAKRLVGRMLPSFDGAPAADVAAREEADLVRLAGALALFRHDRGSYPDKLEALTPVYAESVPTDRFIDGAPLRYARTPGGFVLYSVGKNRTDDGGLPRGTPVPGSKLRKSDDVVVRVERGQ